VRTREARNSVCRALLPLDLHAHLRGGETVEAKHLPNDDHAKRD
jgi:hypothetical protein